MFSVLKQGFCSKLTDEFDKRLNLITCTGNQITSFTNILKLDIATSSGFSPHSAIKQFELDVVSNLSSMVPDIAQFNEIPTLANSCQFTKNDSMLSKPSTLARSIMDSVKLNANNVLGSLATALPTEFNLANTITNLTDYLDSSKMNLLVPESLQDLTCMSNICGTDITSRLFQLESFLTMFNIDTYGNFNTDEFLSNQGIPGPTIQSINRVTNQISYVNTQIENSFSAGIDRLKALFADDDDDE